ncbi:YigZ family protein [bacterium]|nr:YigZ family protein [bacterium]
MALPDDTYKTIAAPTEELLFKEKKSKFFSIAYPILNEAEVKPLLEALKKKHHTANHVCYAWQLGIENPRYRANDDGEPNNSAGMPIYGQLLAFDLKNVLVAVTRIFGGTKLGVGGLIGAYRASAKIALDSAQIVVKTITVPFELSFNYAEMDAVMRTIKQKKYPIISQQFEIDCKLSLSIRKSEVAEFHSTIKALPNVSIK